jgi:hypothetical protein
MLYASIPPAEICVRQHLSHAAITNRGIPAVVLESANFCEFAYVLSVPSVPTDTKTSLDFPTPQTMPKYKMPYLLRGNNENKCCKFQRAYDQADLQAHKLTYDAKVYRRI